jgi:hypothetical protein
MFKKASIFKLFYSQWRIKPYKKSPGYTILLTTPADLPVFLKIAMNLLSLQKHDSLVEVLVIPDKVSQHFLDYFASLRQKWHICPIRIIKLLPLDRLFINLIRKVYRTHWFQMVRGVEAVRSTHAVFHDADLFFTENDFLEKHYKTCQSHKLVCFGVSEIWDSRFREQGFGHLVATWEMMFDIDWFRSFKPWQHRCQKGFVDGKFLEFDLCFLPQCLTTPNKIRQKQEHGFIHFNYVITSYRIFQKSQGPYEDRGFCLLLIRLLIDMYDRSNCYSQVPLIHELEKGLTDNNQRVTYRKYSTRKYYPTFRLKLQRLIDSGVIDAEKKLILQKEVALFDNTFGWEAKL